MNNYKYHVLRTSYSDDISQLNEDLNEYASAGWKLVGQYINAKGSFIFSTFEETIHSPSIKYPDHEDYENDGDYMD